MLIARHVQNSMPLPGMRICVRISAFRAAERRSHVLVLRRCVAPTENKQRPRALAPSSRPSHACAWCTQQYFTSGIADRLLQVTEPYLRLNYPPYLVYQLSVSTTAYARNMKNWKARRTKIELFIDQMFAKWSNV